MDHSDIFSFRGDGEVFIKCHSKNSRTYLGHEVNLPGTCTLERHDVRDNVGQWPGRRAYGLGWAAL